MLWFIVVTACIGSSCKDFPLEQAFSSSSECYKAAVEIGKIVLQKKDPWGKFDNVTATCSKGKRT